MSETNSNRKKLLFLIHTLGCGGAEKVLVNIVNNLDQNVYDVTVMTVIDTGIYKKSLSSNIRYKTIIPYFKLKKSTDNCGKTGECAESGSLLSKISRTKSVLIKVYTWFWRNIPTRFIHRLFIKEHYDVEVAFLEGICSKIISGSPNSNSKKICWIHVDLLNQHKSGKVFRSAEEELKVYSCFDEIVCVSEDVRAKFLSLFPIKSEKVIVMYNPIDNAEIILKSKQTPSFELVKKRKFTMCSVGRLNAQKSHIRLLECCKELKAQKYDFDIWIIGEGTNREQLVKYILNNDLSDMVTLLGFQENPYFYMSQADMFVCSSIAEGFNTAATEATILGIPIVTTNCAGMTELLGNSEYGIVTENSVTGLLTGIKKMIDSPELMKKYKEQAQSRGKEFDIAKSIEKLQRLF